MREIFWIEKNHIRGKIRRCLRRFGEWILPEFVAVVMIMIVVFLLSDNPGFDPCTTAKVLDQINYVAGQ